MKPCSVCKVVKPLEDFVRDRAKKSGFTSACRACRVEMSKRWRHANAEYVLERDRRRPPRGKQAGQRRWLAANLDRVRIIARAGMMVQRAIKRGELMRPSNCEDCGRQDFIEAAHVDYSRPLTVRWLCRRCHVRWDHAEPKSLEVVNGR